MTVKSTSPVATGPGAPEKPAVPRVCAVILTYNRRQLLAECLAALDRQTRPADEIVVIDNAGTDGTPEMLYAEWPRVRLHRLPRNAGAAGGFCAAFETGYRSGADWVWVMDDDVLPDPDALERLLDAARLLSERGRDHAFLVSLARDPGGHLTNVPDLDDRRNALDYQNWPDMLAAGIAPVRRATFVSILLPRRTIAEHGLPIEGMVMWGEDTEYTLRISRDRPGYIVGASRVVHVRAVSGKIDIRTETDPRRIRNHALQIRNRIYISRSQGRRRAVAGYVARYAGLAARLALEGEMRKAAVVARGLAAGLVFRPRPGRAAVADGTESDPPVRLSPGHS